MKNLSKLSLLVVFLSIFISTPAFALTPTNKSTPTKAVLVASVNIKDAKIVSQKGNVFNISFSLSNGAGLQTGVKYGVKLISESKTGQLTVDEKVYDEALTLNPNTTTKKDIVYTAPTSFSGSYTLMLTSNNSSGFPFGIANLGKVTLTATTKGVEILPETCTLQVAGDKTGKTYSLAQGVGINNGESISLTCEALNSSKVDVTAIPSYEVHSGSSFGDIITQSGGSAEPITFKTGEKKSFSVTLPKATTPQIYNVNFTLNDKDIKSNSIDINYIVYGVSATVDNVSLDKDYYNKGDTALLSLVYKSNSPSAITSKIQISNAKGKSCAELQTQTLTKPIAPKVDTSIVITSSCVNPKITVTLTDDKGVVLAQKEFNVKTTSAVPLEASKGSIAWIIILLVIIIIVYLYLKNKKNKNNFPPTTPTTGESSAPTQPTNSISMNIIFPFFLLVALFGFMPINKASAGTYSFSSPDGNVTGNIILDQTSYTPSQSMYISAGGGIVEGQGYSTTNILLEQLVNGSQYKTVSIPVNHGINPFYIANYFTAPSAGGTYSTYFGISYTSSFGVNRSYSFTAPFDVIAPPAPVSTPVTVTVYAQNMTVAGSQKSASALTVPTNTSVQVSWTHSSNAISCSCTYYLDATHPNASCGGGVNNGEGINPSLDFTGGILTLAQSKTFTVTCTDGQTGGTGGGTLYYPTCFIADTIVTLADGTKKNIQDVKVGDVLKGEKTDNKVLGLHRPDLNGKLYSFNGGRYFVTAEHPFKTINGWKSINPKLTADENIGIKVGKLKVGDTLITESGYVLLKTISSKVAKDDTKLYNFILDGDHTYYADDYLVHNKAQCDNSAGVYCGSVGCVGGNGLLTTGPGTCGVACTGTCGAGYTAVCDGTTTYCSPN